MSINVHDDEVHKFNAQAAGWWDPTGSMRLLHELNPLRLNFIEKMISLNHKNIIDVGCGGGILAESLAAKNATVLGIDMAAEVLRVAKLHALESSVSLQYQCISAEQAALEYPEQFDIVTCMELIEHVPDPHSLVKATAALTKPGGTIFFSTINRTLKAYLTTIIAAEYLLQMLPRGTHDYEHFITPAELCDAARAAKLTPFAAQGIQYQPLSKQFSYTDNMDINYLLCFQKPMT